MSNAGPRDFELVDVSEDVHDCLLPGRREEEIGVPELRYLRRPRWWSKATLALLASAFAATACIIFQTGGGSRGLRWQQEALLLSKSQTLCDQPNLGVELRTGEYIRELGNVPSAETCLSACKEDPGCQVWTWGQAQSGAAAPQVCSLKGLSGGEEPLRLPAPGMVSGQKCPTRERQSATQANASTPGMSSTVLREGIPMVDPVANGPATSCGRTEDGLDYWTQLPLYQLGDVDGPEQCCQLCQKEFTCKAWTWGKSDGEPGLAKVCFLKGLLLPSEQPSKHPNTHVISGHTCRTMDDHIMSCKNLQGTIPHCGEIKDHVDYWTEKPVFQIGGVATAEDCITRCQDTEGCAAWTWGKLDAKPGLAGVCFMKGLRLDEQPQEHHNRHVQSGRLCHFRPFPSQPVVPVETTAQVAATQQPVIAFVGSSSTTTLPTPTTLPATPPPITVTTTQTITSQTTTITTTTTVTTITSSRTITSSTTVTTITHTETTTTTEPFQPNTLYCFAVMLPTGYERGLVAHQFREKVSIFDCDEYAVFSSRVIVIAPGMSTTVVNSDLHCDKGGEFNTAMNTEIFFAVWDKVVEEGRFNVHAWTVKADPDTVFLPSRLRMDLAHHTEHPKGTYINNCWHGLHGPLEVFSRIAVWRWSQGRERCVAHFTRLCSGPCQWGEDMFIDQCLSKVLGVHREDDWSMLQEDHCDPPMGWESCLDVTKAAFHPFKDQYEWERCMHNAGGYHHPVSE